MGNTIGCACDTGADGDAPSSGKSLEFAKASQVQTRINSDSQQLAASPHQHPSVHAAAVLSPKFAHILLEDRDTDVFISHSQTTGQDQAGKLALMLKAAGFTVWYVRTVARLRSSRTIPSR